jgi:hypothetical protein
MSSFGLRPLGADEHLSLLLDAGVDTAVIESWLARRATVEVEVVEAPAGTDHDDEPEFGAD